MPSTSSSTEASESLTDPPPRQTVEVFNALERTFSTWPGRPPKSKLLVFTFLALIIAFTTLTSLTGHRYRRGGRLEKETFVLSNPPPRQRRVCSSFSEVVPGRWTSGPKEIIYSPLECVLPKRLTPTQVEACFKKRNITRVAVLGDSQGPRYARALEKSLPGPHRTIAEERGQRTGPREARGFLPQATYYSRRDITDVKVHVRDCSGCRGKVSRHGSITVDQHPSEFVMDTEVTRRDDRRPNKPRKLKEAWTTQEFLTKLWWREPRYQPQLVLHLSTVTHDFHRKTPEAYERDLTWAMNLWGEWSQSTSAHFLSLSYHLNKEDSIPAKWRGITRNDRLRQYNGIWRRVLSSATKRWSSLHVGPDMENVSVTVPQWVYADGVHFKSDWYDAVISQILLPVFCADTPNHQTLPS